MIKYSAKGFVLGNYWGGGRGSYAAKNLIANTREELITLINAGIESGSLDAGMGYKSLIGAVMKITEIDTREIDGKYFKSEDTSIEFFGKLSENEEDFLMSVLQN